MIHNFSQWLTRQALHEQEQQTDDSALDLYDMVKLGLIEPRQYIEEILPELQAGHISPAQLVGVEPVLDITVDGEDAADLEKWTRRMLLAWRGPGGVKVLYGTVDIGLDLIFNLILSNGDQLYLLSPGPNSFVFSVELDARLERPGRPGLVAISGDDAIEFYDELMDKYGGVDAPGYYHDIFNELLNLAG